MQLLLLSCLWLYLPCLCPAQAQAMAQSSLTNLPVAHVKGLKSGDLYKGILFIKRGELSAQNSRVIVPVTLRYKVLISQYNRLLSSLSEILNFLKVGNFTQLNLGYEADVHRLQKLLHLNTVRVTEFFYSYRLSHNSHRPKRGAIDFVGTIGSALFGLATDEQVRNVESALRNLTGQSNANLENLNILTKVVGLAASRLDKMQTAQISSINSINRLIA